MKFDSNAAWKQATAMVSANREVAAVLAGVFFVLPSIAFSLFFPQPEPPAGATPQQMIAIVREFYGAAWPFMLAMAAVQMVGTLTVLTLFTDRSRPTVGEAIREGAIGVFPYLGAQLLLGFGLGLVALLLLGIAGVTGSTALIVIVVIALLVIALYAGVKTSLAAPVIAVERERNPVSALRRSWQLTKGNSVRLALFYVLVAIVFIVLLGIVMGVIGLALALVVGGELAKTIAAVFSAVLGAAFALYFAAILAAAHRQLAGPSSDAMARTFD